MAENEEGFEYSAGSGSGSGSGRSFGKKCTHLAKKQRAKFYILRRCIAMLVCWHEKNEPGD